MSQPKRAPVKIGRGRKIHVSFQMHSGREPSVAFCGAGNSPRQAIAPLDLPLSAVDCKVCRGLIEREAREGREAARRAEGAAAVREKAAEDEARIRTIRDAIERSSLHNEVVEVAGGAEYLDAVWAAWDGDWDHVSVGEGEGDCEGPYLDVWGWNDSTPDGDMEWRLRIVPGRRTR